MTTYNVRCGTPKFELYGEIDLPDDAKEMAVRATNGDMVPLKPTCIYIGGDKTAADPLSISAGGRSEAKWTEVPGFRPQGVKAEAGERRVR